MSLLRFLLPFLVPLLVTIDLRLTGKVDSGFSYSVIFKGKVAEEREKIRSLSSTVRLFCFLVAGYEMFFDVFEDISGSQPLRMFPSTDESRR